MDKKIKNYILYSLLFLVLIGFSFTPLFGNEFLWKPENNKSVPYNGIYFDVPTNISNLKVVRSQRAATDGNLVSYDIEFEYAGTDSSMRVVGMLAEQSFFGDTVVPKHSNATLKGEYENINNKLFSEILTQRALYMKTPEYKLASTSQIRIPLSESVKNYKFKLTYKPRYLVYSENNVLGNMSVFLTNARVDSFTDTEYTDHHETQSFVEGGMYVNTLEMYNSTKISNINTFKNVNNVIFILSVILLLALIWLDKMPNEYFAIGIMMVSALTIYRFLETGVTTKAALFAFPVIGFVIVLLGRFMKRSKFNLNRYDLPQGLVGAILLTVLAVFVYVIPKTF